MTWAANGRATFQYGRPAASATAGPGWTAEQMRATTEGTERDAIEAETNRRGAPP